MDAETAIRTRRSIRKFRPDPVPNELIGQVLDDARWSPSWANTQCWNVYVVTGEALDRIKAGNRQLAQSELGSQPDFRMPVREWPAALSQRTAALIKALSPAREKTDTAQQVAASMADVFGAPCLLLIAVDQNLVADYACFDSGLFVQTICLAAHARGLGTCIMAMAVRDPEMLRKVLPGATDRHFVVGVALGYPDSEAPINTFERSRAGLDELVTWVK